MYDIGRYYIVLEYFPTHWTYNSTELHKKISSKVLSDTFCIGIEREGETLRATLQRGVWFTTLAISRRYREDWHYSIKSFNGKFAIDTIWLKSRSLRSKICSHIYSHNCGFNESYCMSRSNNENVGYSFYGFISYYWSP